MARTGRLAGPADFVVKPVETRRERKAFLELPWQIYRDDPNWMPPLRMNQKELVGYARHPFYDDAQGQTFLALRDGKAIGRIQAIENPVHNRFHQERRGFFGFFEAIDNQAVANALLDAARAWLAARDIHQIRGPVNPSLNYECGLLVEGFHLPPSFMMTYNPPYYPRLIESYGFRKRKTCTPFGRRPPSFPIWTKSCCSSLKKRRADWGSKFGRSTSRNFARRSRCFSIFTTNRWEERGASSLS